MDQKQQHFLPFHAINEFMMNDFRKNIIQDVFQAMDQINPKTKAELLQQLKRKLELPGFRNPNLAPKPLQINASIKIFETDPVFTGVVLSAWLESQVTLFSQIESLLIIWGWDIFPVDYPRTKLPGFLTTWPEHQQFKDIITVFREKFHDAMNSDDEIALMAVWSSMRLPVEMTADKLPGKWPEVNP